MAAEPKYDMAVYPMTVAVRSASDGARAHLVQLPFCDCPDFTNRRGQLTYDGTSESVTICKHIREALARVGGWNRAEKEETFSDLTRVDVLSILRGSRIGMTPRASNAVLAQFAHSALAEFEHGTGISGVVRYDQRLGRYTMTVTFA